MVLRLERLDDVRPLWREGTRNRQPWMVQLADVVPPLLGRDGPGPMNALEVLHQDAVWVNREGHTIPLKDIDGGYAGRIVAFLERRAPKFHRAMVAWYIRTPWPTGEQAEYAVEQEYEALLEQEPSEWLHDQPLVRALKALSDDLKRGAE